MKIKNTRIRYGIISKLGVLFVPLLLIFYIINSIIYVNLREIENITHNIVNVKYEVADLASNMTQNLLNMEVYQNKYNILKSAEYKSYFEDELAEYERTLYRMISVDKKNAGIWGGLRRRLTAQFPERSKPGVLPDAENGTWIKNEVIEEWLTIITEAEKRNVKEIQSAMQELNRIGRDAGRVNNNGIVAAFLVGIVACLFIAYSFSRPLRELRRGIRAFSNEGVLVPVRVLSRDEFGELASAFNEMAGRLKEEERMRTDFIAVLSHELRTPLTSVKESVNLVREEVFGPINEKQKKFLGIASFELERLTNLLTRLMRASSMSAETLGLVFSPLNVNELVEESVRSMLPAAQAKEIGLYFRIAQDLPPLSGDFQHLRQTLINLIGNALKFSPPGSSVNIEINPDEEKGIVFCVRDNGPGIPENELALVFLKYYRGSEKKNIVDGIGLGLSIVKTIIEAHGGNVRAESTPGSGTAFYFSLPAGGEKPINK